ncbi:FAD-dependent oxidoreductase [Pseudomonas sp. PDM15]|nr:FAD-dependent oxidoreductase [Pseudomonas sp. PDM15]
MLSALLLGRHGRKVVLFERKEVGQESSWAGGGIVSPLYPWRYGAAIEALANWSADFYPQLGRALADETGIDPEVYPTGLYWLDLEDEACACSWGGSSGQPLRQLDRDALFSEMPVLGASFTQALHMPGVANVRNPRLLKSLRRALVMMPEVTICESSSVDTPLIDGNRVIGVKVEGECYLADQTLLAAGAWSAELLAPLGLDLPVEPVKGQMILYKCASNFLTAIVLAKGRYAIPRKDGHILVGSTLEHVGFDKTPTDEGLAGLKASAQELLPALADAEVVGHWAGLRPGSPDGIPYIGELPQYPGLWLNCGHYRNGLVLAPASCELLKNLMLGEAPIIDPAPYSPAWRLG